MKAGHRKSSDASLMHDKDMQMHAEEPKEEVLTHQNGTLENKEPE